MDKNAPLDAQTLKGIVGGSARARERGLLMRDLPETDYVADVHEAPAQAETARPVAGFGQK